MAGIEKVEYPFTLGQWNETGFFVSVKTRKRGEEEERKRCTRASFGCGK
jgi:hypothetical protein